MTPVEAFNFDSSRLHYIDADKYRSVSRSRALCGLSGKRMWRPMALYFGGCPKCKTCHRIARKHGLKFAAEFLRNAVKS